MADPFVAEIRIFGFNFPPSGWAFCDGQLMPISQNTALFSLCGTNYGGNGTSTFGLPDLKGRMPMHPDQGPGLSPRDLGEQGGNETVTLATAQIPAHTHTLMGGTTSPVPPAESGSGGAPGVSAARPYGNAIGDSTFNAGFLQAAGAGVPHNNMPPYVALNFCIALTGVFPPRP